MLDASDSTIISMMDTEIIDPGDVTQARIEAVAAVGRDSRIPNDFQLYVTNSIIEMDYDGANEKIVATLHTFARYIDGIRVATDPSHGEYLNVIIDGTEKAEINLFYSNTSDVNPNDPSQVKIIPKTHLLSREKAIAIGLIEIQRTQEETRGYYDVQELRSAELLYVKSKASPDRFVLAWEIIDTDFSQVVINALDGSTMYWSL